MPPDAHRSHPVSVDVSDVVQVELSEGALNVALTRVPSVLGALAAAALEDGAADVERVTPRSRRRSARVDEVSLVPVGPSTPDSELARYLLVWQLAGPASGSHLEADLSLVSLDAERSELRVEGTWRQDPDPDTGLLLAGPELERLARRTLRAFLRRLARALEEQPGNRRRQPGTRSITLP